MCTTVERVETDDCDWYSCGEWCLSKSREQFHIFSQHRLAIRLRISRMF